MKYAPVNVHLPDGTTELVPLPERYRGRDMWLADRDPEDTRLTRPRLDARVQALHAAVAMRERTASKTLLGHAAELEAWLLRPVEPEGGA